MYLTSSADVSAKTEITLNSTRLTEDDTVSILFGNEQVTLEFYDVESLYRLRDLAAEGAQRLQALLEANAAEEEDDAAEP